MFKYWREKRRLKMDILRYKAYLLGVLSELIFDFKNSQEVAKSSGISDKEAVDLLNKIKGIDEKEIVSALVDAIKSKEKSGK